MTTTTNNNQINYGLAQGSAQEGGDAFCVCVKCGHRWRYQGIEAPALPDARPRWSRFVRLLTCPNCGDCNGHAGVISKDFTARDEQIGIGQAQYVFNSSLPSFLLQHADEDAKKILLTLSPKKALWRLMKHRGYSADLAQWLVERGVRVGSVNDLRFRIPLPLFASIKVPRQVPTDEPMFWLPCVTYDSDGALRIGNLQCRRVTNVEPRFLTVRLSYAPLVHIALPTSDGRNGKRWDSIWVTEGILKAEITAYKLGIVAIGALGTGALQHAAWVAMDAARRWHTEANLFAAPIVLAPDADARTKISVAKAWWSVFQTLQSHGFPTSFAVWPSRYKGVDDALLGGETPTVVEPEVWLANLKAHVRDALLQVKVRPRLLLDKETALTVDLPESPTPNGVALAEIYEASKRQLVWMETFRNAFGKLSEMKTIIVADLSPTGSGKTKAAAKLSVRALRKAGLCVKRVVYIAPEVKRCAVPELERFWLFKGRDDTESGCAFYGRLSQVEAEGLDKIGRRICAYCPIRKLCGYYAQKHSGKRQWRVSLQSYSPREGDFVILDEVSRLPLWRDYAIDSRMFNRFVEQVRRFGSGALPALEALGVWLKSGLDKSDAEVRQLFFDVPTSSLDALAHDLLTLISDIRPTREWIFGKRDGRPVGFWWAAALLDILRGHVTGQVWCEHGVLRLRYLEPKISNMVKKATGILILDATANPNELERLFNAPVLAVKSDDPEVFPTVIQVPIGLLTHRARPESQKRALWLAKQTIRSLQNRGILPQGKIGVLTHKGAAEIAQAIFGKDAVVGWFGRDERGTNIFYNAGVRILVVCGLPHRNVGAIAAEQLKAGARQRALRKVRLNARGDWWTVIREFADPELAQAVRRESAIAYLQAAGRLRQNRRTEHCFVVVVDTEPLPLELNPIVLPPEKVLPLEIIAEIKRHRQRGVAVINELRQKAKAEKLAKAAEAIAFYKAVVGESPPPAWLAKVLGVHRNHARVLVHQTAHHIYDKDISGTDCAFSTRMTSAVWCISLMDAVLAFVQRHFPIPYRALARRFNVHHKTVLRYARRIAQQFSASAHQVDQQPKPSEPQWCHGCGERPADSVDGLCVVCRSQINGVSLSAPTELSKEDSNLCIGCFERPPESSDGLCSLCREQIFSLSIRAP